MDTLAHTALGACLGEVIAGKQLGKKAMLLGALANNLPDIDVITSFWMSDADSLLAHRGFTHSILFVLLCTPLLAYISVQLSGNKAVLFRRWMLLYGVALFAHIFVDAFTTYGTGWFEPFSHYRVSLNTLFIVDPMITLPLLISTLVLLVLKRKSQQRKRWAKGAIVISSAYLVLTVGVKLFVNEKVKGSLSAQKITWTEFMVTPTPFNIFLWYIVVHKDADYYIGYYSVFDKTLPISFQRVRRNDLLVAKIQDTDDLNKIIRFSKGYYSFSESNDTITISDMRFGQVGGWYQEDSPYVFNYNLKEDADNSVVLQRGRIEGNTREAFRELIDRIRGK